MVCCLLLCGVLLCGTARAIDIVNHLTLPGGAGTRDGPARHNTLFMKLSCSRHQPPLGTPFVAGLSAAIEADQCEPSFSGRGERTLTITIYCAALQNKGGERHQVASEKAPLPPLPHTQQFLQQQRCQVDDYEYLGEYRKPQGLWAGNDDNIKLSIEQYFQNLRNRQAGHGSATGQRARPDVVRGKFVEHMAPWGLDRIDMHFGLLDNDYTYHNLGEQVDIYVVDTGIRLTHQEFGGRASFLINTVGDNVSGDCVGHGTHVSSLAAGTTYGAAKGALLWDCKSLGCNGAGDTFTIVTSIMAIIDHAAGRTSRRAVVSMSLGGDYSIAINNAILSLVTAGINVVVAAGNEYSDACLYSPSSMGTNAGVLTVAASTQGDARPSWSNYGSCVSITAPGESIIGAYGTSNAATAILSGTSMATPFVSGVVALVLNQNLTLTPQQVKSVIVAWQTPAVITGTSSSGGGKNLVYSLIVVNQTAPQVVAPTPPPTSLPLPSSDASPLFSSSISLTMLALAAMALLGG